jgi:transcriptional regulator GlxA family with amidase domain
LRSAHARGARLASTCVGAFTLAATGLLDGLTATTHSRATPAQWLIMARIRRAQHLLETTDASIERIAGSVGFGAATFRDQFRRGVGISPHGYRRAFYSGGALALND